jgi:hypothetical protein
MILGIAAVAQQPAVVLINRATDDNPAAGWHPVVPATPFPDCRADKSAASSERPRFLWVDGKAGKRIWLSGRSNVAICPAASRLHTRAWAVSPADAE